MVRPLLSREAVQGHCCQGKACGLCQNLLKPTEKLQKPREGGQRVGREGSTGDVGLGTGGGWEKTLRLQRIP